MSTSDYAKAEKWSECISIVKMEVNFFASMLRKKLRVFNQDLCYDLDFCICIVFLDLDSILCQGNDSGFLPLSKNIFFQTTIYLCKTRAKHELVILLEGLLNSIGYVIISTYMLPLLTCLFFYRDTYKGINI